MLNVALKVAKRSTFRHQMGAVIVKGGRVLSCGHNQIRYAAIPRKHPESLHAEAAAILKSTKLRHDLAGSSIYVARYMPDGSAGLARPCEHCMALIRRAGIKKVIWSDNDGIRQTEKL
jgi:deoxycytidylate deaminase